jgi:deazaflavin-dependent oxidoreductase (nitroreductase family)
MPDQFLYLTTTGRTTGEPRRIEIWFAEHAGRYYLVSERREHSGWVKNIERCAEVSFSVGTRENQGEARPLTRARARIVRQDAEPELARAVAARMDAKYGWSSGLIVELAPVAEPGETAD